MGGSIPTRGTGLMETFLTGQRIRVANRLIPPDSRRGRLLDVGCGSYPLFLAVTEFSEKYGIDKTGSPGAPGGHPAVASIVRCDVEKTLSIPFESGFFDVVTMLAVLEHIDPPLLPRILHEVHRVLKPGGIYILTTPARWTDGLLRALAKVRLVSPDEIWEHKDTYTHGKLRALLETANFPGEELRFGYFECFANLWAVATKPP